MSSLLDAILELRIILAGKRDMTHPRNWRRLSDLIRKRSDRQIRKMEVRRGLVK